MPRSIQDFYDRLGGEYHLIFGNWDEAVKWQGEVLDTLLRSETGRGSLSILDCSCGIGTQAIGLALLGHRLTATDLSPRSIERAREEARRGKEIRSGYHLRYGGLPCPRRGGRGRIRRGHFLRQRAGAHDEPG